VDREYGRLVQCYGTANFMEAFLTVRLSRPGAPQQVRTMLAAVGDLKGRMQPEVLAASTVRTEARFRADYSAVGDRLQSEFGRASNPDTALQTNMRTLSGCETDVQRWRGAPR
jgi:hypothetical protein